MKHFYVQWLILGCTFLLAQPSGAQPVFQKTYGGNNFEYGYVMRLTVDGGAIIGGVTSSSFTGPDDFDSYLVKIDSNGNQTWAQSYGMTGSQVINDLWNTADGGYIFGGYSYVSAGSPLNGNFVVKVDANGDTLWSRLFSVPGNFASDCYAIMQASDGNYIIGDYSSFTNDSEYLAGLIKLNKDGDTIWTRIYNGTGDEWIYGINQTNDGGFILSGYTTTPGSGGKDMMLIKTDSIGNLQWDKAYGGALDDDAFGHSVQTTTDGGYILFGFTNSFGAGGSDMYLVKTDSAGNLQWSKTYGGPLDDIGHAVQQTSDGGYILLGWTYSFGAGVAGNAENVYLIKTNATGDTLWTRAYGGTGTTNGGEVGYAVKQMPDGYLISGRTLSFGANGDIYVIKTDLYGNAGCNQFNTATQVGSPATQVTSPLLPQSSGFIVTHPPVSVNSGGTATTLCDVATSINTATPPRQCTVYPNPFSYETTIYFGYLGKDMEMNIYDVTGNKLRRVTGISTGEIRIERGELPAGIYFYRLTQNGNRVADGKLVVQ